MISSVKESKGEGLLKKEGKMVKLRNLALVMAAASLLILCFGGVTTQNLKK